MMIESQENLAFDVRKGDYDRFLCIQLAPARKRWMLYAVTAFHIELARIAESVSEVLIGHIRLAWWREALEEIETGKMPRNHPVVLVLGELYAAHADAFPWLHKMIEARAADLDSSLISEETAWLGYLDATAGALHMAWANLLDKEASREYEATILADARVYATIGLVRAIPYFVQQGFQRFPSARLAAAGLTELTAGPPLNALSRALLGKDVAIFRKPKLPISLRPLTGLKQLAKLYLRIIKNVEYDSYRVVPPRISAVLRILQVKFFLC